MLTDEGEACRGNPFAETCHSCMSRLTRGGAMGKRPSRGERERPTRGEQPVLFDYSEQLAIFLFGQLPLLPR